MNTLKIKSGENGGAENADAGIWASIKPPLIPCIAG